jgi:hypothetical protein
LRFQVSGAQKRRKHMCTKKKTCRRLFKTNSQEIQCKCFQTASRSKN